MKEFLRQYFTYAKCGDIEIQYTPLGTRIMIYTVSPGLVIGVSGDRIREVTERLKKEFGIENPQIDVQKIREPDLDPNIVAQSIAFSIEKNVNFKKLGNFYLDRIMSAGAVGVEIVVGGKLGGDKARSERFVAGYIKKAGEPAEKDVAAGRALAHPPLGIICINVKIMLRHLDNRARLEFENSKPEQGSV